MFGGLCVLGGIATFVAVPAALTSRSYIAMKKYVENTKRIQNALKQAPDVEDIRRQRQRLTLISEKLEDLYRDYNEGVIGAKELFSDTKKAMKGF